MSKHTRGPWVITGVSIDTGNVSVGQKHQRIVIADVTNASSFAEMIGGAMRRGGGAFRQSDCTTQFANAHLIAAAPDLYEALHDLLTRPTDGAARVRARAALDKAEGRHG